MNEELEVSIEARMQAALDRYWQSNLRIMAALLFIWAFVAFGCAILWADWLNQQGSIVIFVICILVYCLAMNRLDRKHHEEREAIERSRS
jgi:putative solute:sodium symporter small subunit